MHMFSEIQQLYSLHFMVSTAIRVLVIRPQSKFCNCLKCFQEFPKISLIILLKCSLLYLHYALKLATFLTIVLEHFNL